MAVDRQLVHVRFAPNGTVTEIGECPANVAAQSWFHVLSKQAGDGYQPLSGGRGVFRIDPDALATLQARAIALSA